MGKGACSVGGKQGADQDKVGLVAQYSTRIKEIFEITNNAAAYREELEHYLFAFRQDDLTYVNKMKARLTPEVWNINLFVDLVYGYTNSVSFVLHIVCAIVWNICDVVWIIRYLKAKKNNE